MRIFVSIVAIVFITFAVVLFWKIDAQLGVGLCLFTAAMHIEIGLRSDDVERRLLRVIKLFEQWVSGVISG